MASTRISWSSMAGRSGSGADLLDPQPGRMEVACAAIYLARRYARTSNSGSRGLGLGGVGTSTQHRPGGARVGGVGRHGSPCRLTKEGTDHDVRPRAGAELQLPLWATRDAAKEELPPIPIRDRRRAMRDASSSSSGANEVESSLTSAAQSMESDSLPTIVEEERKGRRRALEQSGREE